MSIQTQMNKNNFKSSLNKILKFWKKKPMKRKESWLKPPL